ncbi:transcriptional antiterminator RfaH [Marinobacter daqiaonensis]|uniref:Transcriptional antiterminator RfaH n=1 Tax=Marinobacter daqiaonensis TaxID=650891 RepID=A0A1I6H9Z1_9GAMM|nr:transcription/translation regulatory transformer protein RfaH [Marinobacter daqiaonensis]SFR51325.1 transcriptional antiterminator RfaH [Marinobacter daqiaonensis]
MPWYAIQHKPAQGDRALENLQNQDARCFYPKVMAEKIRGGKRTMKLEPLFPGYLFIHIDPTDPLWGKLRSTRGVLRVVSFGGKPMAIPDDVIDYIYDGLVAVEKQGGLKKGEKVQIQGGPFRGMEAIFDAYEGEERAVLLISFMQKQQAVSVPLRDL